MKAIIEKLEAAERLYYEDTELQTIAPPCTILISEAINALRALMSAPELDLKKIKPAAWIIPGDDTVRDHGFIDAKIWEEGEFTRPLYNEKLFESEIIRLREELAERSAEINAERKATSMYIDTIISLDTKRVESEKRERALREALIPFIDPWNSEDERTRANRADAALIATGAAEQQVKP